MTQDDGKLSLPLGTKDICPQDVAIIHLDGHIPLDPHAVADLASEKRIASMLDVIHGVLLPRSGISCDALRNNSGGSYLRAARNFRLLFLAGLPRWLFLRNDRQHHIGLLTGSGVQGNIPAEDMRWPVARIVVRKQPTSRPVRVRAHLDT